MRGRGHGAFSSHRGGKIRAAIAEVSRSPFALMPAWIVAALSLYALGWSNLFVTLRSDTLLFLAVVSIGYLYLAVRTRVPQTVQGAEPLNVGAVALLTCYFIGAFIENGGVPLLQVIRGEVYDIYGFGVDGLHILMLSFTGYYGVRAFNAWLTHRRWYELATLLWVALLLLLIVSRSALSFLAFACVMVYVVRKRLRPGTIVGAALALLLFAYLFGVVGDIRLSSQIEAATGRPGELDAVRSLAQASAVFDDSGLSPSWLWAYIYFVSPVANLNSAFSLASDAACVSSCAWPVVIYALLPYALGGRLGEWLGIAPVDTKTFLVAPDLTASTAFGPAVASAGFVGGIAVAVVVAAIGLLALRLARHTPYAVETQALVGAFVFFTFFDNPIAYTPFVGQVVLVVARSQRSRLKV